MHFDLPITLEKTVAWYESNLANRQRYDATILNDGVVVAFAGITKIDPIIKKGESYTFVCPKLQGKGYGYKARRLLLDYTFDVLGLNKVYAFTNEDNYASIGLSNKLGFTLEGRLRKEYLTTQGDLKDRLYFGLLKDDWK